MNFLICRTREKDVPTIQKEIQAIIRQITASVTSFRRTMYSIPFVSKIGTFEILVYTNRDAEVPLKWEDSDPHFIPNAETVKLRSFSTSVRVDIC